MAVRFTWARTSFRGYNRIVFTTYRIRIVVTTYYRFRIPVSYSNRNYYGSTQLVVPVSAF